MAEFKIALTAGHYLGTPGKRCLKSLDPNETREWVLNNRIADKVEKLLKEYTGYKLIRTDDTTGKKDISLDERTDAANKFGADFYLSIHHNAGIGGGSGGGIVSIVYTGVTDYDTLSWQKELYNALVSSTGLKGNRSTPLAKMDLHEVRETNMPAVLLELGFMDSKTDVPVILTEAYADKCAKAIVAVIAKRGGLKKKAGNVTAETEKQESFETALLQAMLRQAYAQGLCKTFVKPIDNKKGKLTKAAVIECRTSLGYKNPTDDIDLKFITELEEKMKELQDAKILKLQAALEEEQSKLVGDFNEDGKIDIKDATAIQKHLAGME